MVLLYGREIEVKVAGLTISEPRISVTVERQIDQLQTKGSVDIYNLSVAHEEQIYRKGAVAVSAGYPETRALIFEGFAQRVIRAREGQARITRISLGDMEKTDRADGGGLRDTMRTYPAGEPIPVRQIVMDIAADMKIPLGPLDAIPADATTLRFYWAGPSGPALTAALRIVRCTWYERDGLIRINRAGMLQSDAATIDLSPATGLVESAIETDEGAEAQSFLNPAITLGCRVNLKSDTISGSWKVVSMRHNADNWEGKFLTWMDLRSLDGSTRSIVDQVTGDLPSPALANEFT